MMLELQAPNGSTCFLKLELELHEQMAFSGNKRAPETAVCKCTIAAVAQCAVYTYQKLLLLL